ncbi:MAG: hypothetical protein SGILL_000650 [Bacillariaceae sp.]
MDTDSPASYPKHLMGAPSEANRYQQGSGYQDVQGVNAKMGTPVLAGEEGRGVHSGYEAPPYRGSNYHGGNNYYDNQHYQGHTPPRSHGHYLPEMETSPAYGAGTPNSNQQDAYMRPRRWACDYCHVATFVSYEEACAHEEQCARQYHERYGRPPHQSRGPVPQYDRGQQQGAVYPGQDSRASQWGARGGTGPPMPPLSAHSHEAYYQQGHHQSPYGHHHGHHQHHGYPPSRYNGYPLYDARGAAAPRRDLYQNHNTKRMLLAMGTDADSLSDRQCYVRSEMVEIFAATEKDVSARHSKGAQKLIEGQVGIRCVHCAHLRPRDRAERAVCYPSSISRIYQTVADMQRFHFEQCREIPMEIRKIYKSLKTTRPRGVGSPQTYWIQSAKLLDLVDSNNGIRFGADLNKAEGAQQPLQIEAQQDETEPIKLEQQPSEEPLEKQVSTEPLSQELDVKEDLHEQQAEPQSPQHPEEELSQQVQQQAAA